MPNNESIARGIAKEQVTMIKWHYEGEPGFWHSVDGRFEISPRFRHTVNPDSYQLRDTVTQATTVLYTVRDAKARAERIVASAEKARQMAYESANAKWPLPISGTR